MTALPPSPFPELHALLFPGITLEHLARVDDIQLSVVESWSQTKQDEKREALIEKIQAVFALAGTHAFILQKLYGLPEDADIETWIEDGRAPEQVRKEWQEMTEAPEYRFFVSIVSEIVGMSPRRAVGFLMDTAGAES